MLRTFKISLDFEEGFFEGKSHQNIYRTLIKVVEDIGRNVVRIFTLKLFWA